MRRDLLQDILRNPETRRTLMIQCIIATQSREGINTTYEQAERAYDKVHLSKETKE